MSEFPDPTSAEEAPVPSAALIVSRVIVDAWLDTVDRRDGARFLGNLAMRISAREELMHVVPIRRGPKERAAAWAERQAHVALRELIAVWIERLAGK